MGATIRTQADGRGRSGSGARLAAAATGALAIAVVACAAPSADSADGAGTAGNAQPARAEIASELLPRFTADGKLVRPEGWEGWVLAGTSMGLTYNEPTRTPAPGDPPGMFLNVYIQPWAYERFMEEGEFPEGTMFVLSMSEPVRKADPARGGFYQGPLRLMEVHLKREGLHESGWGFFGFGGGAESAEAFPGEAACYSCHAENGDFDNAFVQFYPKIRERLGMDPPAAADAGRGAGPPTRGGE